MTWEYWICLYTQTHCTARGLRANTIAAYETTLRQFREYVRLRHGDIAPYEVTAAQVLMYLQYLRQERDNGDSAVQRQLTILKSFYAAMAAMGLGTTSISLGKTMPMLAPFWILSMAM